MSDKLFEHEGQQLILRARAGICTTPKEIVKSDAFLTCVKEFCNHLEKNASPLLKLLTPLKKDEEWSGIAALLETLTVVPLEQAVKLYAGAEVFLEGENRFTLHEFVEALYDYWRSFDRFMVLLSSTGTSGMNNRPYRAFNMTMEALSDAIRAAYRDLCENITGDHPRIYRQVTAGCDVGLIAVPMESKMPAEYTERLAGIPFIRQVMVEPPFIIDPPMNKRTGRFERVDDNPLLKCELDPAKWLCYPCQIGPMVMFVYFHQSFMGLGCALCNLFELATDEQIKAGPDAVYLYGAPAEAMKAYGDLPTVFYDDEANGLLTGAVPAEDRFGYFGYLKKMMLTLHNIKMMKDGLMPFHGAMVRITLRTGQSANMLLIGDTATGKSESLEAFRSVGAEVIQELKIIADDMGSIKVDEDGSVRGYGTEIGAFVRLDDLQQGYAFQQMDRAIFMNVQKVNARVVVPVTTMRELLRGYKIDFLLYANNYEAVDDLHPVLEQFADMETAISTFREGAAMAKGTTTSTGLVHTYFANIFGAPQYRHLHDGLAQKVFEAAFANKLFVGQMRTRLGIQGCESTGPIDAATAMLDAIQKHGK